MEELSSLRDFLAESEFTLESFTRIVKHKGSTDADYTFKSNASQISALLTASG
jgi:hypothetical protein